MLIIIHNNIKILDFFEKIFIIGSVPADDMGLSANKPKEKKWLTMKASWFSART